MYIASEIAQNLIRNKAHSSKWTLESYPGTVTIRDEILEEITDPVKKSHVNDLDF